MSAPLEAIERAGSADRVYVVDQSGTIRITSVQLGLEDAHRAEILSGLGEGDQIITGRRAGLNAGDHVRPKVIE